MNHIHIKINDRLKRRPSSMSKMITEEANKITNKPTPTLTISNTDLYKNFSQNLMRTGKPSKFFNSLITDEQFSQEFPLTLLDVLRKTEQSPVHHPEGNVWRHVMLVVDNAALLRSYSDSPEIFMWSALLHDLGKGPATKVRNGKITAYDHDIKGEKMATEFLKYYTEDIHFIHSVSKMVRWHMQVLFVTKKLPYADIKTMISEVDIYELALLAFCDRMGRGNLTTEAYETEKNEIMHFAKICQLSKKSFERLDENLLKVRENILQ